MKREREVKAVPFHMSKSNDCNEVDPFGLAPKLKALGPNPKIPNLNQTSFGSHAGGT